MLHPSVLVPRRMSAFIPANSSDGGHQSGQIPTSSIGDMYTFPYFPTVINPYGYPINAATGISNAAFPNMNHPSIHMNNMAANLQPNPQIQHLQSDPAFAASLFQNNNFSLYNKNELFEVSNDNLYIFINNFTGSRNNSKRVVYQ